MYGLTDNIDLSFLLGRELGQVAVGSFECQLHFDGKVSISIGGFCEIGGSAYGPGPPTGAVLLHLLGQSVRAASAVEGGHLRLEFGTGEILLIRDSSEEYESYAVVGPNETIVV